MRVFTEICTSCHGQYNRSLKKHNWAIKNGWRPFCSRKCEGAFKKNRVQLVCENCGKKFERSPGQIKHGHYFCSRGCASAVNNKLRAFDKHPNFIDGKSSYRERAIRHYGSSCSSTVCPIQMMGLKIPEVMLDVHHKDFNRSNNKMDNLEVLCVWCHATKTRC